MNVLAGRKIVGYFIWLLIADISRPKHIYGSVQMLLFTSTNMCVPRRWCSLCPRENANDKFQIVFDCYFEKHATNFREMLGVRYSLG